MMLLKCCTHHASKVGKHSKGHRTEKDQFSLNSKEGKCHRMFILAHNVLISHASKVTLDIFQAMLQKYVNREFPYAEAGFSKSKGTKNQTAHNCWIIEKAGEFQENIYFCFINCTKAFDNLDHNKL